MQILATRALTTLALAAGLGAAALPAIAQTVGYPDKAIRLVIPSTPGGGTDFIARLIGMKLAESTGWNVVPENRPGASNTLGLAEVTRAKPDGYEWVLGQTVNISLAPWLMKLSFDPAKDLTPIALAVESPMVLTVADNSPLKSWADLVAAAKANPGKPLNFATSGIGSVAQVAGVIAQEAGGFRMDHVPYKGSTPALADLMGGHVDLAGTSVTSALALLRGGKIRALAVTSGKRSAALPNVPTLAELGYANFNVVEWYGIFGPPNMPPALADRINAELNKVMQRPDVRTAVLEQGQDPHLMSRGEFAAMVKADNKNAQAVIAKAGIKLQ